MAKSSTDNVLAYWIDAVGCALDECGAWGVLTSEQIEKAAKSMVISAEMQGTAFGHECIPNPLQAEIELIEKRNARNVADCEAREEAFRGELARRIGVESRRVIVHNGRVELLRQ